MDLEEMIDLGELKYRFIDRLVDPFITEDIHLNPEGVATELVEILYELVKEDEE